MATAQPLPPQLRALDAVPRQARPPLVSPLAPGATKPAPFAQEEPSFLPVLEAEERERRTLVPPGAALRLWFQYAQQALVLPLSEVWVLGRATANLPQDTRAEARSPLAKNKTVSREHCLVRRRDDHVIVIDLNSTNGTYLNSQRLEPFREYTLAEGDELRLATLRISIRFVDSGLSQ